MDTLTHALSGALLARATGPRPATAPSLRRRIAAGFLAAAAPDLDFVISYAGPAAYLEHHRGVTHSVLLLPLWALLLSWVLAKLLREPGGWRALYGITALALAIHIVGDLITGFGTILFAPLSNWRVALGATFIIDLWFTGIILAGLLLSAVFRRSKLPAVAASVLLAGYVGLQYFQKQRAIDFGEQYAQSLGLKAAKVSAHPRPVSPFNWTVFVSDERKHRFAHINLVRQESRRRAPGDGFFARIGAPYRPLADAVWETRSRYGDAAAEALGKEAWNAPALGFFRWFADVPAFEHVSEAGTCVWFSDLRFLTPGRDEMPFRFGACRAAPGAPWRAYQPSADGAARILVR